MTATGGLHSPRRRSGHPSFNTSARSFANFPIRRITMFACVLHLLASIFSAAAIMIACTTANAQQPKLEMHRAGVSADDGTGWHSAVSTKGAFSIRLPIPFNDFSTYDARAGEVSHAVGGKSSEGIKFLAIEMPATAKTPGDLGVIPKSFSSNPTNKVSDVSRHTKDGADILSFSVTGPASTAHFRYIKVKGMLYTLSIEFPNAYREAVAAMKDKFFGSFKLKGKS
jgi:hypothetical protein